MPLTGLTADEIRTLEEEFMEHVPADGTAIGNVSLRDQILVWEREKYDSIKARLLDDGQIVLGRGKGGSVKRFTEAPEVDVVDHVDPALMEPDGEYPNERSLYEPIRDQLFKRWCVDQPFDRFAVEDTSSGGGRADGTWSRPDMTVAAMTSYTFVPGRIFDVVSFEIKHYSGLNLTALYEALAHRRAATRSYVLAYVPDDAAERAAESLVQIEEECQRVGIGFIVASNPAEFDSWDVRVAAERVEPDAEKLNNFIRSQLTEGTRDAIVRWFRV